MPTDLTAELREWAFFHTDSGDIAILLVRVIIRNVNCARATASIVVVLSLSLSLSYMPSALTAELGKCDIFKLLIRDTGSCDIRMTIIYGVSGHQWVNHPNWQPSRNHSEDTRCRYMPALHPGNYSGDDLSYLSILLCQTNLTYLFMCSACQPFKGWHVQYRLWLLGNAMIAIIADSIHYRCLGALWEKPPQCTISAFYFQTLVTSARQQIGLSHCGLGWGYLSSIRYVRDSFMINLKKMELVI